jgi:hypothetical protein
MESRTQFQVDALKLRVKTYFKDLVQNTPRWNNNCTPDDLESVTVSEAQSFAVT